MLYFSGHSAYEGANVMKTVNYAANAICAALDDLKRG